ncbi:8048_t:CDS:2 [Dentiscutata erythropus]|uniref:8048_t:CDS:1 n=1 Tax=Dentiscutata erythropus TaxID=1348616 RepID=A0A9N9CPL6_9GLOM|nr:8048_t:CDS:2 [Dentiscutata erythropus]
MGKIGFVENVKIVVVDVECGILVVEVVVVVVGVGIVVVSVGVLVGEGELLLFSSFSLGGIGGNSVVGLFLSIHLKVLLDSKTVPACSHKDPSLCDSTNCEPIL